MGTTKRGYGRLSENKMAHHTTTTTTTATILWPTHEQLLEHMAQRKTTNPVEWEASATSHPRENCCSILDEKTTHHRSKPPSLGRSIPSIHFHQLIQEIMDTKVANIMGAHWKETKTMETPNYGWMPQVRRTGTTSTPCTPMYQARNHSSMERRLTETIMMDAH
jgi:hypothetical protein